MVRSWTARREEVDAGVIASLMVGSFIGRVG
jgi:hypothetical protein